MKLDIATQNKLSSIAVDMMKKSYAPYSNFNVGAALLTCSGKIYTGCNIENASFSPTVCAERVAIFKAVSDGERKFSAIAIAGGANGVISTPPCGVCRQTMREFCDDDFVIFLVGKNNVSTYTLKDMLPYSFSL